MEKEGRAPAFGQKSHLKEGKMSPNGGGGPLAWKGAQAWVSLPRGAARADASSEPEVRGWAGGTGTHPCASLHEYTQKN